LNFFLDTNTCIYFLKGSHPRLQERFRQAHPDHLRVPSMVEAELLFGAAKSNRAEATRKTVRAFLAPFKIVPFDSNAASHYAVVRAHLEAAGTPIGPDDLIIAATVLSAGGCLITANTNEFQRVPGLRLEDWSS